MGALTTLPKRKLENYTSKIPSVLILLWNKVLENNGETSMGIFRLAADADEMKWIKNNLNTGKYDGSSIDENIAATLIKIFFRELPTYLLNHLEKNLIDQIANYDQMLNYEGSAVSSGGSNDTMVAATKSEVKMANEIFSLVESKGF